MRFSSRKFTMAMVLAAAVVIPASIAWSCVALVGFRVVGDGKVEPGGTVTVVGTEFARGEPVDVRLDSSTGPVLATFPDPRPSTMTSRFELEVPIPADITTGPHVLVATQNHYDMNVGIPARAAIYVNSSAPAAATPPGERAEALSVSEGSSAGTYVLIVLGVAAAGLLLAAVASMVAARRPESESPEQVKA